MAVVVRHETLVPEDTQVVGIVATREDDAVVLYRSDNLVPALKVALDHLLPDSVSPEWFRSQGFNAESGQSVLLRSAGSSLRVLLVGVGPLSGVDAESWRQFGAALVRASSDAEKAALLIPSQIGSFDSAEIAEAAAVGATLASYRFTRYRSKPKPVALATVAIATAGADSDAVERGTKIAAPVLWARDLINTPAEDMSPAILSETISERLSAKSHVSVEIWDEARLTNERMGGILGVGKGSNKPPRLLQATYDPPGATKHIVLVGKGVTFDSGGLTIKPKDGMSQMKTDMSGAAIVCAALGGIADLGYKVKVTAIAPMAENMLDAASVKPGDVLVTRDGQTIEVLNTDAEGRLLLADALTLAAELKPDAIVDVATLTGAISVALGDKIAGIFGNDRSVVERVIAAGSRQGEKLWELPLATEYNDHIDSEVADMKNEGRAGQAGSIAAALLLVKFVKSLPWAHLDIAGVGRCNEPRGYLSKGGTAWSTRTLIELCGSYAE